MTTRKFCRPKPKKQQIEQHDKSSEGIFWITCFFVSHCHANHFVQLRLVSPTRSLDVKVLRGFSKLFKPSMCLSSYHARLGRNCACTDSILRVAQVKTARIQVALRTVECIWSSYAIRVETLFSNHFSYCCDIGQCLTENWSCPSGWCRLQCLTGK